MKIIKTTADKEARERLQKLANGNVSDSDTSLFDSHFSYENKETKSEVQKKMNSKALLRKQIQKGRVQMQIPRPKPGDVQRSGE